MPQAPYELFLALRYLRPKRTFVSVITLISVMGVMLGVAVLIIVISVMSGFDQELRDKIIGFNGHLHVSHRHDVLENYEPLRKIIAQNPRVKGVAPYVFGPLLIQTQPEEGEASQFSAPWIRGIDIESERTVSNLSTNIVAGQYDVSRDGVLVGAQMAHDLRLHIGDRLAICSIPELKKMLKNKGKETEEVILPEEYEVRGVFDVEYYQYNSTILVTSLQTAQLLYGLKPSAVHGLMVILHNPNEVDQARKELQLKLGSQYQISSWTEENSGILTALIVEKNVMFYLLFFIMIVAAFGIMNSLITFVVQKTHEIGMMKALGATRMQVVALFLSQSFIVGVVGVLCGLGLGMLGLAYRNPFLRLLNHWTGLELFPADVYGFTQLPAIISPQDIAVICSSAVVICLLAGALPAWVAARLQPVEALRHE